MSQPMLVVLTPEVVQRMAAVAATHQTYRAASAKVVDLNAERQARR